MNHDLTRREFFAATTAVGMLGSSGGLELSAQVPSEAPAFTVPLARFTAGVRYEAIPPTAIQNAKNAILDDLGVAVAGATEESAVMIGRMVREEGAKEEATIYGQRFKSSVLQAAFVNGACAHAQDFDHSFVAGQQPSCAIIPAVFTLGETLGSSGRQILEAYIAGFEVTAALMFAVQSLGTGGWHANGTIGTLGAAAACARLLGLNETGTDMALAIAASLGSGIIANFGTMTKPLHAGQATRSGVLAAKLAKAGFTGNAQALEARSGFFDCHYPGGKIDHAPIASLGNPWSMEKYGVRYKPYPCGGLTHSAILAAIRLRNEHQVTPQLIDHVEVRVPADTAAPLVYRVPKAAREGKFSMPYLIARAIIDGNITFDTFTEEAVRNPQALQLLERIDMKVDPALQAGTDGSRPAIVAMKLTNGQTQTLEQKFPKGSPEVPMTQDELVSKFRTCTKGVLSAASTDRALDYIGKLETMNNIRPLVKTLSGS
ncbi:MAG TPA: MmgE/PrpD family protein [Terriglobia bacterium]